MALFGFYGFLPFLAWFYTAKQDLPTKESFQFATGLAKQHEWSAGTLE
jgi:hypothetical protein